MVEEELAISTVDELAVQGRQARGRSEGKL
jgi:hypothetical protein